MTIRISIKVEDSPQHTLTRVERVTRGLHGEQRVAVVADLKQGEEMNEYLWDGEELRLRETPP